MPLAPKPAAQTTTQLHTDEPRELDTRVPGLTILWHAHLERVGERALLTGLLGPGTRKAYELSRNAPLFGHPGQSERRPLEDSSISRQPIHLVPGTDAQTLRIDGSRSRTFLEIDGRDDPRVVELERRALERGAVMRLGNHVVVLLHLVDPAASAVREDWNLIGQSPAMARVRKNIERVADLDVPVMVRGETGTGKELVARAIHDAGPRADGPYVAVNMAAIPAALAAGELFGARRGAYTGAERARQGHFANAHQGTLFLDEVGEAPVDVQVMLLRALETGQIQPLGSDSPRQLDVRLISATDADLERSVEHGSFRAPVLHRLSGYTIHLPPLRERREDLGLLLRHFLRMEARAVGEASRQAPGAEPWVATRLVARLARWHWPGNVRQLRNVVRQLVIAHRGADRIDMIPELAACLGQSAPSPVLERTASPDRQPPSRPDVPTPAPAPSARKPDAVKRPSGKRHPREISERELIEALRANRWHIQQTARALDVSRAAVYALIERSPNVRTASDLEVHELEAALARHPGDVQTMAHELEVSDLALSRRLAKLGLL